MKLPALYLTPPKYLFVWVEGSVPYMHSCGANAHGACLLYLTQQTQWGGLFFVILILVFMSVESLEQSGAVGGGEGKWIIRRL